MGSFGCKKCAESRAGHSAIKDLYGLAPGLGEETAAPFEYEQQRLFINTYVMLQHFEHNLRAIARPTRIGAGSVHKTE